MNSVDRFFEISARKSTVGREVRGAVATFLTMSYILFVNADILKNAGVPFASAVACTALAAGVCCILMGLVGNFPMALASGMGLNAVVAFTITPFVVKMGYAPPQSAWHIAMGLVVLNGFTTLLLVLLGLREAILHAIPRSLRLATGAGIGLFIAFIGLANAKLVVPGPPGVPLTFGSWHDTSTALAFAGLLLTAVLVAWRVRGALIIGIFATTAGALLLGLTKFPTTLSAPSFEAAFHADVLGAFRPQLAALLFSLIIVDFFDTLGTATAIAEAADLHDANGKIPRVRQILAVDSISAMVGGTLGVSSVTSYIESAAGVAEGARTGLHTVIVGVLFLAAIVLAPVAGIVPPAATAPALILVGFLMMSQVAKIDFDDLPNAIPAFITLLTIPLTYSIAHGIGYGFIAYVVIHVLSGKPRDVHPLMYVVTAAFAAFFWWG